MADKHARYLQDPKTGHVDLIVADQVEDKQKAGWKDPDGVRANGYVYNREEDQGTTDAAGAALEARNAYKADKDKKEAEEKAKADKLEADAKAKDDKLEADAKAKAKADAEFAEDQK